MNFMFFKFKDLILTEHKRLFDEQKSINKGFTEVSPFQGRTCTLCYHLLNKGALYIAQISIVVLGRKI